MVAPAGRPGTDTVLTLVTGRGLVNGEPVKTAVTVPEEGGAGTESP